MRARSESSAWEILAPAKLNFYLDVLGRRDDGFHELETVMAPVRVFDRLAWSATPLAREAPFTLAYHPATSPAIQRIARADRSNLVWRAFESLGRTAGIEPYGHATLFKRIPVQAGMGGASSDAAAALMLANSAWGINYSLQRLAPLAAELGSDVPFFLAGSTAICRGRGERIEPVCQLPPLHLVVAKPPAGVSTPAAFAELSAAPLAARAARDSHGQARELIDCWRRGKLSRAAGLMVNRLQAAAARLCPWIDRLRCAFDRTDCLAHMMTGSGSAYFGVARSARQAAVIARRLAAQCRDQWGGEGSKSLGVVFATATY